MITREKIFSDYRNIKVKAEEYFNDKKFEKCLAAIEAAAFLAYNFNLFYVDEDIEEMIRQIGKKYNTQQKKDKSEKLILFDSFGYDNKGLTQQYVRALIAHDVSFSYILGSDRSLHQSKNILDELSAYPNADIHIISDRLSRLDKIVHLNKIINEISPTRILTHRTPWDTVGHAVFSNLESIEKFHINLTDHAFWLGKNAADYFIEFRSYGANISVKERKIDKTKLLHLPYYPIVTEIPFQGFPIDIEKDKTILFTGANFYKMYGDNGKFFSLLKRILNENQNTLLLIAGSGHQQPLDSFIKTNNFHDRIFLLGDRKDINKVFANIDIYIATYPITGGLMGQYAALNKKPIVAYTDSSIPCNIVEEFVVTDNYQITHFTEDSFCKEVSKLVNDKDYRQYASEKVGDAALNPEIFNTNFYSTIFKKNIIKPFTYYEIDVDRFADIYLEAENNYLHFYDSIIFWYFKAVGKDIEINYYSSIFRYILKRIRGYF